MGQEMCFFQWQRMELVALWLAARTLEALYFIPCTQS